MSYYGVKEGRVPGVYTSWDECSEQVIGYSGAVYKKFKTEKEALEFIGQGSENISITGEIPEDTIIAYVDGSFDSKNHSYSFGAVMINDFEIKKYSQRYRKDQFSSHRNVSGELKGAVFAMRYAIRHGYKRLILHYDYEGIEKWAKGKWKTNTELTKGYKNFYNRINTEIKVEFVKVDAHTGDTFNEMADKLAKEAKYELQEVN